MLETKCQNPFLFVLFCAFNLDDLVFSFVYEEDQRSVLQAFKIFAWQNPTWAWDGFRVGTLTVAINVAWPLRFYLNLEVFFLMSECDLFLKC